MIELFQLESLTEVGSVILRTATIFAYAFLHLRLLGKHSLAHLNYIDLLLIISFGSAVGDVMIYSETSVELLTSMIAITVVSLLVKVLSEFSTHSKIGAQIIEGHARLLIYNGKVVEGVLAKEDLTEEKLLSILREKGFDSIKSIPKAFVEPDGEISIVTHK